MNAYSRRDLSRLLVATGVGLAAARVVAQEAPLPANAQGLALDHIVFGVPDLEEGIRLVTDLTGVEAVSGGLAPGRPRPHNALIALGNGSYLEIIAPRNTGMTSGPWLEAISDGRPHILDFAERVTDRFAGVRSRLQAAGVPFTAAQPMGRVRPDGGALNWELLNFDGRPFDGVVPFFIDWLGSRPHPSESSPSGVTIESFFVVHPRAAELARLYQSVGIDVPVLAGSRPARVLLLNTPKGRVYLA